MLVKQAGIYGRGSSKGLLESKLSSLRRSEASPQGAQEAEEEPILLIMAEAVSSPHRDQVFGGGGELSRYSRAAKEGVMDLSVFVFVFVL